MPRETYHQRYLRFAQGNLEKAQGFLGNTFYANAAHYAAIAKIQAAIAAEQPDIQTAALTVAAAADGVLTAANQAAANEARGQSVVAPRIHVA